MLGSRSPRFRPVSEADVRAGFERARPALDAAIAAVFEEFRVNHAIAYLVFDVVAHAAFDDFPIRVEVFDEHGESPEGTERLAGRQLLPGITLLPPAASYPLGRVDVAGADTLPDAALVERACVDEFRQVWRELGRTLPGRKVLIGAWGTNLERGGPFPLTDLDTGEPVEVDVLWDREP